MSEPRFGGCQPPCNTLSFARHQIPCNTLSINYNFPLHVPGDKIRALNPDLDGANSAEDVKIFHYLGEGEFNKEHFATLKTLEASLQIPSAFSAPKNDAIMMLDVHPGIAKPVTNL